MIKSALIISLIGFIFLFATDINPYNLLLFLFFQIVAISYMRNKMKEQHIGEMEDRIRKLEEEKAERDEKQN